MKNNDLSKDTPVITEDWFKEHIYIIRGQQVMLDFDLAEIYGYEVKRLNEQVKRNVSRFPEDFMFQLRSEEVLVHLKSQFATLNAHNNHRGMHIKKMPYAFTEQGIYMLATVLKGELAVQQSQALIRLFKSMKDYLVNTNQIESFRSYAVSSDTVIHDRLNHVEQSVKLLEHEVDEKVSRNELEMIMERFEIKKNTEGLVLYQGQWFSADNAFDNIFRQARHTILIVDPYIGIKTLNALIHCRKDVQITIFTKNTKELPRETYEVFLREHHLNIQIFRMGRNSAHDRFIFIDHGYPKLQKSYIIGSSIKDSGNSITTITEAEYIHVIADMFLQDMDKTMDLFP
ncbi:MAG: ORF6N domain-containing protein [Solobacterium sp.]|nr:ORF6N domain-containing protein [Solobacterium sp.]